MSNTSYVPNTVGILGLGLIGGSFAKAFIAAGMTVYAYDIARSTTAKALEDGLSGELDEKTCARCELIILASYPAVCMQWLEEHADLIADDALVMDVTGIKRTICKHCMQIANNHRWTFVGAHPMAGTQYSGYKHARATLFHNAPCIVVLPDAISTDECNELIKRLKALLAPCSFSQLTLSSADFHDEQIAYTSQLAHVVSNAYVKSPTAQRHKGFSAGSYKDLTRVARLNAPMWCELFLANADNLSHEISMLIDNLQAYKHAIDSHDAHSLQALLAEGDRLKREAEAQ